MHETQCIGLTRKSIAVMTTKGSFQKVTIIVESFNFMGAFFFDCGFFADSWGCHFVDASFFSFSI